jgi:glycosyltransferase involved in cell wall biosynthesis
VGIVGNEFFDVALGRMGGFGWAARSASETLRGHPELGYRPVYLAGRGGVSRARRQRRSNGVALVRYDDRDRAYARALARERVGLLLAIDHRPNYVPILDAASEVPLVVWVRDPRTPGDVARIAKLEIPGGAAPDGIEGIDCRSLAEVAERRSASFALATPAPAIAGAKLEETYGVAPTGLRFLPNPVERVDVRVAEADRPLVLFLGRLDPIKRPWVFVELARRLPHVDFAMLGQAHFTGPGGWRPTRLPANLRLLGHVDGPEKRRLLGAAWLIVNTSIHEALPISFLEALHSATPIVSCRDPESVTSRFGVFVGDLDGSGLDGLDALVAGVERLVEDRELRAQLGETGREWARATHTRESFLAAFAELAGPLVAKEAA